MLKGPSAAALGSCHRAGVRQHYNLTPGLIPATPWQGQLSGLMEHLHCQRMCQLGGYALVYADLVTSSGASSVLRAHSNNEADFSAILS